MVQNQTHGRDEILKFSWELKMKDYNWNGMSPKLSMKESGADEFRLYLQCTYNSSNSIYFAKASLTFLDKNHGYDGAVFEVKAYFVNSAIGHCFRMSQSEEDAAIFKAINFYMYEPSLSNVSTCNVSVKISVESSDNPKLLLDDMRTLLRNGSHSDLKLHAGGKTYDVHRAIVSARSNVLARMIESDMLERKNGEIRLQDVHASPVCDEMLNYVYTGECDLSEAPHELLKLAHFLELHDLQSRCKRYLLDHICEDSIVETLLLTNNYDQYDLLELKLAATKFVEANEVTLMKRDDFLDYLSSTICCNNLAFVMRLANNYQAKETLDRAIEFIRLNYKQVLRNQECKDFLSVHGDLMLRIYEYSCDKNALIKMKGSDKQS